MNFLPLVLLHFPALYWLAIMAPWHQVGYWLIHWWCLVEFFLPQLQGMVWNCCCTSLTNPGLEIKGGLWYDGDWPWLISLQPHSSLPQVRENKVGQNRHFCPVLGQAWKLNSGCGWLYLPTPAKKKKKDIRFFVPLKIFTICYLPGPNTEYVAKSLKCLWIFFEIVDGEALQTSGRSNRCYVFCLLLNIGSLFSRKRGFLIGQILLIEKIIWMDI